MTRDPILDCVAKVTRAGPTATVGSALTGFGWKRVALAFFLLTVVCGIGGCGDAQTTERLVQTKGNLRATLAITPYPPAPMQDVTLTLTLQGKEQPVTGASVGLTLTMPNCSMPPSVVVATEARAGVYEAETILAMAGAWQADADVALPGRTERFTFSFATQ